ncbi:NAD(P)/FAD-dependent oxidoreductase [Fibrella forsythiae]|uniref:FAD-dependent oxidoreductase n=1 Tax=Fibrella forsythiae TaxID=2817061 RepID=A0ABS3JAU2_9BACT|nr:NAD(P)/FAD-dependent oxidoreductase [Fibrella forsythiae]MBO0947100.1 FAD-dependent oxidoreductase [Fibrella forsythiae]
MPIVIIGAGMAGLTCANYLHQKGRAVLLLDAQDVPGGRVRTDVVGDFRLDRGFQILLTAYPEAQRMLNYTALDLKPFRSGAAIHHEDSAGTNWMTLVNPFSEPMSVFKTLFSSVGTLSDKLLIADLIRHVNALSTTELFNQSATTTATYLRSKGFSEQIIERFFRPFFGGVFLEDDLTTSSNFFEFCFKNFFLGDAAIPALGIGEIPRQLASRLPNEALRLNTPVDRIYGRTVHLASGEQIQAEAVVLAVDARAAARLLGKELPALTRFNHTTCTYFSAPAANRPHSLKADKLLMLNTRRSSAVHNLAILSDVAPAYAPADQLLISVSTQGLVQVDEEALTKRIRTELTGWFGESVQEWRHLRTDHIPEALPSYGPDVPVRPLKLADDLYQCGDQTAYPSLNAAMQTGRLVAEML